MSVETLRERVQETLFRETDYDPQYDPDREDVAVVAADTEDIRPGVRTQQQPVVVHLGDDSR